jgi:hypothetical protein
MIIIILWSYSLGSIWLIKVHGWLVLTIDEDTIMDHADFDCLSWKEILSLIDDY